MDYKIAATMPQLIDRASSNMSAQDHGSMKAPNMANTAKDADRDFALMVIANISTAMGLREYARRLRANHPRLSDLADECERRARQAP